MNRPLVGEEPRGQKPFETNLNLTGSQLAFGQKASVKMSSVGKYVGKRKFLETHKT